MILDNNLKLFKARYGHIDFSDCLTKEKKLKIVECKDGSYTAILDGLYLHSKHNPKREVIKQLKQVKDYDLLVLAGLGLGYQLIEAANLNPNKIIVVVEPDKQLFFEALELLDITKYISNLNIHFLIDRDSIQINNFLIPQKIKKVTLLPLLGRVKQDLDYFNSLKVSIDNYLERLNVNRNTLKKFGKLWVKNQCKNIPQMGYKGDISDIFDSFNTIPGIIISAGPSMELIIPHLKELKDRFLILAVDTAFKSLLEEGIEPDFVMSIDSQYWNSRHLEGAKCDKTVLIADSAIQSAALRPFKNRVYFTKSSFPLGRFFEQAREDLPKIASGGSVSTNIWDFANRLGLKEIFFIGQDLGFPGNITHYKNSYFEKNMLITADRLNTVEKQSYNYIYNGYPELVTSNSGEKIISDKRMNIYIKWFKEKLKNSNHIPTYNLSPNGCKIEGMPYKNVGSLLNYPINRDIINKTVQKLGKREPNYYLPRLLDSAKELKRSLSLVTDMAIDAYNISKIVKNNLNSSLDISVYLQKLDDIDQKIINSKESQTLSFMIEPFIDNISQTSNLNPLEALELSLELYNKLAETGNLHIRHITQSIKKIENSLK